ncbi:MAG: GLPGLI family protein, partial [Bacteroidetes bacterium]|nr:GLPGLI family protein [Bacteroidota bacterium]
LDNEKATVQKLLFGQSYLLQDSTRRIRWKITDETRNIAGFECRRANALILDSVYVVAFYTDEIPTSGGPESFSGLPGMILGLALPHEHISWFASYLQATAVSDGDMKTPAKGKKISRKDLQDLLKERMKGWGKSGRRYQLLTGI